MTNESRRTVSDEVARAMVDAGVRVAFGHPGGEVVVLIDAMRRAGIRFVLAHHETTAAFMAGGLGEVTGRPGVCVSTLGPGAANMVGGVASALLERAPMLALTGTIAAGVPAEKTHQRIDLNALYKPVSKRSVTVTGEDNPYAVLHAGFSEALAERPGPVHVALASDVAASSTRAHAAKRKTAARPVPGPTRLSRRSLGLATRQLSTARRPALLVGLSAVRGGAAPAIRALAARLQAPVMVTAKAKGVVPDTSPMFLGAIGMAGDEVALELLERRADLVIAIGLDGVELDRTWSIPAPILRLEPSATGGEFYPSHLELFGPLAESVTALAERASRSEWSEAEIVATRNRLLSGLSSHEGTRIRPWQVVKAATESIGPERTIATCDVGAHKLLVAQLYPTDQPRAFFVANGLSSMGYAIPVAIAAKLAHRNHRVIAFVGDGGLSMYLGELETITRLGLTMTVVVFADGSLELIRRAGQRLGVAETGVRFANPDFRQIAAAYGATAHVAESPDGLAPAFGAARAGHGLQMVVAHVDRRGYRL